MRSLWEEFKNDNFFVSYFPDAYISGKKTPNRQYFFDMFSTLYPNEFQKMLSMISTRREIEAPAQEKISINGTLFN